MLINISFGKKGAHRDPCTHPPEIRPGLTSLRKIEVKGIIEQFIGNQYKIIIRRVAGNRDSAKSCLQHI